jgi:hypothetical protein
MNWSYIRRPKCEHGVAGSETVARRRPLEPGAAIYGVRRLDAAFIALESGSKLPHSIAGRNRRPEASIVLPRLRNIKTRKRGFCANVVTDYNIGPRKCRSIR